MTATAYAPLTGGRRLALTTLGPASGLPLVALHGGIGTPLRPWPELHAILTALDVRWLAISRPGFGGSDPDPGRTLRSFGADVEAVADHLGLDRFAVLGISAGGPYALACAHRLAGRLTAVALAGSPSPLCAPHTTPGTALRYRLALGALAAGPSAVAALARMAAGLLERHPGVVARALAAGASGSDRTVLDDPSAAAATARSLLASARVSAAAMVEDYLIDCRPWGFALEEVETPVRLWHGMGDRLVPVEHALQLAVALPRCHVALDPHEGHFFLRRRLPEILTDLLVTHQAATAPTPQGAGAGAAAPRLASRRLTGPIEHESPPAGEGPALPPASVPACRQ